MVVCPLGVARCAVVCGHVARCAVVSGRFAQWIVVCHAVGSAQIAQRVQDVIFQSCTLRHVVVVQSRVFQALRNRCAMRVALW